MNESAAITSLLSAPAGGEIQFFSSLYKGLVDCRSATNRDLRTGEKLPTEEHDSWVGALGYLSLLDLIGTCLTRKDSDQKPPDEISPFIHALETFGELTREEISVLYALRCAFAHDFSLYNVHPSKPELTHYFQLRVDPESPLVLPAKKQWHGDYRRTTPEFATAVGLVRVGDLVEGIYANLLRLSKSGNLKIRLPGGIQELNDRYSVMKISKSASDRECHGLS